MACLAVVVLPMACLRKAFAGLESVPKGDMMNGTTLVIKLSATAGLYFVALQLTAQLKALAHDLAGPLQWQWWAATGLCNSAWVGVVWHSGLGLSPVMVLTL